MRLRGAISPDQLVGHLLVLLITQALGIDDGSEL